MKKFAAVSILGLGVLALMAPGAALAAGHKPPKGARVAFGTICDYTAGKSVTISLSCGSSSDATVNLNKHTRLVYEGSTNPAPAPVAGDAAAAFLRWHKGAAIVKKLEFSESAFGFAHAQYPGTFVSSTGDCTSGTLTIQGQGKKGKTATFNTDANTVYLNADAPSDCATVTGAYTAKERINVTGRELTDGSWYAARVNANPD